ncbi:uncharacterized protein LOC130813925 isoform X1 [Amaranthus tricolor]|uniref:uncharacterized protein LOC130813925 isoform X1 n=1 Tax=Amaranthus tricolor TaxID=29722 RepID=UPI002588C207|nr:uncharacterized protein LOC130813925 isoform X1 [Amaranthus tricolor]
MDQSLIFELSSDDEVGFDNSPTVDNFGWITKLLEDDNSDEIVSNSNGRLLITNNGVNNDEDDSDDVVVVGEVIVVQKPKKPKALSPRIDDDEDDCIVLDGDPDKPKGDAKKSGQEDDLDDSDDLLIVGEKGQVACRDYPHARHSCAKFPFSSTPHENRCALCHCYVCDSVAPCDHWGSGVLTTDHCHATDKEEYWKQERKSFRQMKNPGPMSISKPIVESFLQPSQLHPVLTGPNQLLRAKSTHGMSSTDVRLSNRLQTNQIARQLLGTRNVQIQANRVAHLNPRTRMVPSRPIFKRAGFTRRPGDAYQPTCYAQDNVRVACIEQPLQLLTGQNNPTNSRAPFLHLDLNPNCLSSSTSSMSPVSQGYNQPSPHTSTLLFHGYGQSAAVASDTVNSFTCTNQTQSVPVQILPCSEHSAGSQNIFDPAPDILSSVTPISLQISTDQAYCSPILSSSTSTPNNDTLNCQQLAANNSPFGVVPMHEVSTSMQQNVPISGDAENLEFDFENWLDNIGSVLGPKDDGFVSDTNNQASMPEPLDTGMLYFDFETSWKGLTRL